MNMNYCDCGRQIHPEDWICPICKREQDEQERFLF